MSLPTTTFYGINMKYQSGPPKTCLLSTAKFFRAGSPPETFSLNSQANEIPSQADNADVYTETITTTLPTLSGSTFADVHTGYGPPSQGQTSKDLGHDGQRGGVKQRHGLAGLTSNVPVTNEPANLRIDERQRALDHDRAVTGRGDKPDAAAKDLPPKTKPSSFFLW